MFSVAVALLLLCGLWRWVLFNPRLIHNLTYCTLLACLSTSEHTLFVAWPTTAGNGCRPWPTTVHYSTSIAQPSVHVVVLRLLLLLTEQPITLFSAKCKSLLKQRKKPAKLTWTQVTLLQTRSYCAYWPPYSLRQQKSSAFLKSDIVAIINGSLVCLSSISIGLSSCRANYTTPCSSSSSILRIAHSPVVLRSPFVEIIP